MKIGDVYYEASVDDETGAIEIDEWILRTIRGGSGFLTLKASWTWGKRSKKHGDFGWLNSIPDWCRVKFSLSDGAPQRFARSKSAALRIALANVRKYGADDYGTELQAKIIKALSIRIKNAMTRKRKAAS